MVWMLTILAALAVPLALPAPGHAHWADLAVAEIAVGERDTRITLTFPTGLVSFADDDRDGKLSSDEVRRHRAALEVFLGARIRMSDGDREGTLTVQPLETPLPPPRLAGAPGSHSTLLLTYAWPDPVRTLNIHYGLFLPGVPTASCLAAILRAGRSRSIVFTPDRRDFSLPLSDESWSIWPQARSFLALGIEHILTGYDHILFLLTLLMLGGGLRSLIKMVTAFTVAHSLTLSLAVLDVVTLPGRLVESTIALSIVYVAVGNLRRREQGRPDESGVGKGGRARWPVTFGFGLIHGLGFASILKEVGLPRANLPVALVSFNVGVEVGQIAIVAATFLALRALQRTSWDWTLRRWVSAGAGAVGMLWFVQRALL